VQRDTAPTNPPTTPGEFVSAKAGVFARRPKDLGVVALSNNFART
jgi:hypothetical protein